VHQCKENACVRMASVGEIGFHAVNVASIVLAEDSSTSSSARLAPCRQLNSSPGESQHRADKLLTEEPHKLEHFNAQTVWFLLPSLKISAQTNKLRWDEIIPTVNLSFANLPAG
jgi:hypothetical protein